MTRLCALGVALLLVAAACSGSDAEPTTSTAPTTTTSTSAASPTTTEPLPDLPVPEIVSTIDYGGSGFDYALAIDTDASGRSFVALDYRSSDSNNGDVVVLAFDSDGEVAWSRTWGGGLHDTPFRNTVAADGDGGVYVGTGVYDDAANDRDLALLRFDAAGDLVWQRMLTGVPGDQRPHAVAVAGDGSVFLGGHDGDEAEGGERALVMRVGADGEPIWQKSLGGSASAEIYAGALDSAGDFVVAGTFEEADEFEGMIVKITSDGDIAWQYRWGEAGSPERIWDVVVDPDDNIYVAGPVVGIGNGGDSTFVLKIAPDGTLVWARTWTIPDNEVWSHGSAYADGALLLSGFIRTYLVDGHPEHDSGYLLDISADGDLHWQAAVGSSAKESIEALRLGADGTVIAVGQGARRDLGVVPLFGEWSASDLTLVATDLDLVDLDRPFVDAGLEVGPGLGTLGGGGDADALIVRLSLPMGV